MHINAEFVEERHGHAPALGDQCEQALEGNYVDSHGQSEIGFAITRLLDFDLLPRIKQINKAKLYSQASTASFPELDATPQGAGQLPLCATDLAYSEKSPDGASDDVPFPDFHSDGAQGGHVLRARRTSVGHRRSPVVDRLADVDVKLDHSVHATIGEPRLGLSCGSLVVDGHRQVVLVCRDCGVEGDVVHDDVAEVVDRVGQPGYAHADDVTSRSSIAENARVSGAPGAVGVLSRAL